MNNTSDQPIDHAVAHDCEDPLEVHAWRTAHRLGAVAMQNMDDALGEIVTALNATGGSLRPNARRRLACAVQMVARRNEEQRLIWIHQIHLLLSGREHLQEVAEAKQMVGDQFAAIMLRDLKEEGDRNRRAGP